MTTLKIAKECGYFQNNIKYYKPEQVQGLAADNALYICTGSQANYRSALSQIAKGENKYVKLSTDDTIIFSSKIIPGNEDKIEHMQEKMIEQGVTVITEETHLVHASGHATKDDLKKMYNILKPKIIFPVHGNKRFIREHKRFALACGIKDVCSGKNGQLFKILNNKIENKEEVFADVLGVDRGRCISLSSQVVQNRRRIAYNCSVFASLVISADYKIKDFQISSLDILEENDWKNLIANIIKEITPVLEKCLSQEGGLTDYFKDFARGRIRRYIEKEVKIKPVAILHFYKEGEHECL